ncbi:MAG: hypothetical protein HYV96_16965 [Opitutae bacterium]|nr:hypothetical protein [Opitutae bacterium]
MSAQLLCLTHSQRSMDFSRATLNFLTARYARPDRLKNLPPLDSLADEKVHGFVGNVTLWEWSGRPSEIPILRTFIAKSYKAQHACVARGKLLICGTAFLEIYPQHGPYEVPEATLTHPWFAGAHTVSVDPLGRIAVSCSAPDAVLFFDWSGNYLGAWRLPDELYGPGYRLEGTEDLRAHYIGNDLQIAHINAAFPFRDGLICSSLIPGAIGAFDGRGVYRELLRGFVGAHGARGAENGGFYFCDSCNGLLTACDAESRIQRRFKLESVWLHDALQLADDIFLCAVSDRNTFELWNARTGECYWKLACSEYGATTQFISASLC